jgi:hypothetical protein
MANSTRRLNQPQPIRRLNQSGNCSLDNPVMYLVISWSGEPTFFMGDFFSSSGRADLRITSPRVSIARRVRHVRSLRTQEGPSLRSRHLCPNIENFRRQDCGKNLGIMTRKC